MSGETITLLIAIVGVGAGLAALTIALFAQVSSHVDSQTESLRKDNRSLRVSMDALSARVDDLYKLMLEQVYQTLNLWLWRQLWIKTHRGRDLRT